MTSQTPQIDYSRQRDFLDPDLARQTHVSVIGCGTVGSHAAHELVRLGIGSLSLFDDDTVGPENIPSQRFRVADIGRPKAEALAEGLAECAPEIRVEATVARLIGGEPLPAGPVVMAVDSMGARKAILETSVAWRPGHPLVVEGRMGGDGFQILAFDPCDPAALTRWGGLWFPDEEAHPLPCGGRSVSYIGAFSGALIAAAIRRHLAGEVPIWLTSGSLADSTLMTMGGAR